LGRPASLQITHEGDVSESSIGYHAKSAAPQSSSEGDIARLELERQLSVSLAAQTERDRRIVQLTDELALKGALLEQAEANATVAAKRAGLELREHADRLLMQPSPVKQRGVVELRDMQAKPLSRDQQIEEYEKELADVRAKLEARESELEAVRLRLADAEKGWIKSKAEADVLRAQTAANFVRDEDEVIRRLMERVRAIEAQMASKRWNEKDIEAMECRNEG
jgi:vacuolar-type H+-ATPase subunit I/STV1